MASPTSNLPEESSEVKDKLDKLEREKKRIQDEFNIQRAKMKELFLQKEDELVRYTKENERLNEEMVLLKRELDDLKSQLVVAGMTLESNFEQEKRKANEEIASLQQLIHETVEESSSTRSLYDSELRKLQNYIQQLQHELAVLKHGKQQSPHHTTQEQSSLAPSVVLNALTKGIVKKLGAESFTSQDSSSGGDDNANKKTSYGGIQQDDPELLQSLIGPLEDQIQALKEKLRATDSQLQRCRECGHQESEKKDDHFYQQQQQQHISSNVAASSFSSDNNTTSTTAAAAVTASSVDSPVRTSNVATSPPPSAAICDMCSNYEAQLVKEQQTTKELEQKVRAAEKAAERHKTDLVKEIGFRKEMEEKWNEKKEEHKQQVAELTRSTECAEQDLRELRQMFDQTCVEMRETLMKLTGGRERIQAELLMLQKENDNLVGKYTMHSQEFQSKAIDLPNTIEELHELALKYHQDLIIAKIGKEAAEEKSNSLQSDIMLLKDQILNDQHEKESLEDSLVQEINQLKRQKHQLEIEKKLYLSNQERLETSDRSNLNKIAELQKQLHDITLAKTKLEELNTELRTRVSSLQQDLDTSEAVQKDFVRLSQSLQVQLEKIRESDTQVRWQHEEDVTECSNCHSSFTTSSNSSSSGSHHHHHSNSSSSSSTANLNRRTKEHCRHCGQIFCQACLTRTVESGASQLPSRVCDVCHTLLVKSSAPYFSEAPPPIS